MTQALTAVQESTAIEWTPAQVELVKKTVALGASNDELKMFLGIAKRYNLDPFVKEIWCIKRGGQAVITTSRDGYLKIANEHPNFDGIVSDVVYEKDQFKRRPDGVEHVYGAGNRGRATGAYALVYRNDRKFPVYVFAPWSDYGAGNNPTWKKYPHAMILKVAEAQALKRAFSLSGLVTREELDASEPVQQPKQAEVVDIKSVGNDVPMPINNTEKVDMDRVKGIWNGYMDACGQKNHAVNAIKQIVGTKKKEDWTDDDMTALEEDLHRRCDEKAEQEKNGTSLREEPEFALETVPPEREPGEEG